LNVETRAEISHERLIAIGFGSANMMVKMRGGDPVTEAIAQRDHGMEERNRIGTAGNRDQNQRAAPYTDPRQRCANLIDQLRFAMPTHNTLKLSRPFPCSNGTAIVTKNNLHGDRRYDKWRADSSSELIE